MQLLLRKAYCVLAFNLIAVAAPAATTWTKVTDGPLEMYTADDPKAAGQLLLSFARLRFFFTQAAPFEFSDQSHLAIIAFNSEQEFSQYRLNAGSCAFYQKTGKGEYVVLQDLSFEHRDVSSHEFTHFVIAHTALRLPLWINEGIADLYSTLSMDGENAVVGKAVPGRVPLLRRRKWMPLNSLFAVNTSSDYYSDPEKMPLFYSQSWALVHMLALSPEYSAQFPEFLKAVSAGHSSADSAQSIFHKTAEQLEADLHDYVDKRNLPALRVHIGTPPAAQTALQVTAAKASDIDVALSDLSFSNPNSKADIQTRLVKAATVDPGDARAEEALGSMALHQGNTAEARLHFRKAVERHSSDPSVLFYLAHLDRDAGVSGEQITPLLRRALALKPGYYDAQLDLALVSAADREYEEAIDSLTKLGPPRPEHAYTVAYSFAFCYAQTEKFADARRYIALAKTLAATESDKAEVANLLAFINQEQSGGGE